MIIHTSLATKIYYKINDNSDNLRNSKYCNRRTYYQSDQEQHSFHIPNIFDIYEIASLNSSTSKIDFTSFHNFVNKAISFCFLIRYAAHITETISSIVFDFLLAGRRFLPVDVNKIFLNITSMCLIYPQRYNGKTANTNFSKLPSIFNN